MTLVGQSVSGDPTADAGIDVGQRWRDRHTDNRFRVVRTYRDNPINPSFLIQFEHGGTRTVTLAFFESYCERA